MSLAAFGIALVIAWIGTRVLLRWAPELGLIDLPSARKFHSRPTPKGGGLAIFLAFAAVGFLPDFRDPSTLFLVGVGSIIVLLGLMDDRRPLPWQLRLGVQTVAALGVLGWFGVLPGLNIRPEAGPPPFPAVWLPWPLALLWLVGLINAFNMLDNMDALSGGVAWIAAAALAGAVALRSDSAALTSAVGAAPYLALMGAVGGFLWFNRPPARIFMGDAGSTFLGLALGTWSLDGRLAAFEAPATWAVPLGIMAVPWYDLIFVVLLRLSQGRSPFHADKQHLSHRLVERGLTPRAAVGVIYLLALGSAALALVVCRAEGYVGAAIGLLLAGFWLAFAAFDWRLHRMAKHVKGS